MTLIINKEKVEILANELLELKRSGLSIEENIRYFFSKTNNSGNAEAALSKDLVFNNPPKSEELGAALILISIPLTPLSFAILLKQLYGSPEDVVRGLLGAFPNYTALEMGKLLLNNELYPDMISTQMKQALEAGEYANSEIFAVINAIYGQPVIDIEVDFSQPIIKPTCASVQVGIETKYNDYYHNSWIMHAPGQSFIEIKYNHSKIGFSKINLIMVHLTSMILGKPGNSSIDIIINDQMFRTNYNVGDGNYKEEIFNITTNVQEGDNTIILKFCNTASTNYWIKNLKVDYLR